VRSAGDPEQMRNQLDQFHPDIVLLDLFLDVADGTDGFSELRYIKRRFPQLPVIIFTAYDTFLDDPRSLQADGYILKTADLRGLKRKMVDVLAGQEIARRRYNDILSVEAYNALTG
jgi:DNA-binding NarL/FixJ family response regulator